MNDEMCHGHHVWKGSDPDECVRCGFVDDSPREERD